MLSSARRTAVILAAATALLAACGGEKQLGLDDLKPAEREFVTRFVILERARALALADPARGNAALDSLAAAWGDSAIAAARTQVSPRPARAAAVYELLGRILAAETDSLVRAPAARPLSAPLPPPAAVADDTR